MGATAKRSRNQTGVRTPVPTARRDRTAAQADDCSVLDGYCRSRPAGRYILWPTRIRQCGLPDMRLLRLVRRTFPFVLATVAACVTVESTEAVRLLKDIEARGRGSELKSVTPAPRRTTITYDVTGRTGLADVYEPRQPIGAGLVLIPGFTPDGRNDPRLVDLAFSLARARFLVLVPDLPGSREIRVRMTDTRVIADAILHLAGMEALQEIGRAHV